MASKQPAKVCLEVDEKLLSGKVKILFVNQPCSGDCESHAIDNENQHNYYWRDYKGTIPNDAISTENLYIAQVLHRGILPGTLYADKKEAVTESYGSKLIVTEGIKILCTKHSDRFYWEYANVNKLTKDKLEDCVVGGTEENSTLYIGKTYHEGEWKVGKIFPPTNEWKGLRVWKSDGSHHVTEEFGILKYKTHPIHVFEERENY